MPSIHSDETGTGYGSDVQASSSGPSVVIVKGADLDTMTTIVVNEDDSDPKAEWSRDYTVHGNGASRALPQGTFHINAEIVRNPSGASVTVEVSQ